MIKIHIKNLTFYIKIRFLITVLAVFTLENLGTLFHLPQKEFIGSEVDYFRSKFHNGFCVSLRNKQIEVLAWEERRRTHVRANLCYTQLIFQNFYLLFVYLNYQQLNLSNLDFYSYCQGSYNKILYLKRLQSSRLSNLKRYTSPTF